MTNLTTQTQTQLQVALNSNTSVARPWLAELIEEITDLMAEALFQDFQVHRKATGQSPQGIDHTISLTDAEEKTRDAQVD